MNTQYKILGKYKTNDWQERDKVFLNKWRKNMIKKIWNFLKWICKPTDIYTLSCGHDKFDSVMFYNVCPNCRQYVYNRLAKEEEQ